MSSGSIGRKNRLRLGAPPASCPVQRPRPARGRVAAVPQRAAGSCGGCRCGLRNPCRSSAKEIADSGRRLTDLEKTVVMATVTVEFEYVDGVALRAQRIHGAASHPRREQRVGFRRNKEELRLDL